MPHGPGDTAIDGQDLVPPAPEPGPVRCPGPEVSAPRPRTDHEPPAPGHRPRHAQHPDHRPGVRHTAAPRVQVRHADRGSARPGARRTHRADAPLTDRARRDVPREDRTRRGDISATVGRRRRLRVYCPAPSAEPGTGLPAGRAGRVKRCRDPSAEGWGAGDGDERGATGGRSWAGPPPGRGADPGGGTGTPGTNGWSARDGPFQADRAVVPALEVRRRVGRVASKGRHGRCDHPRRRNSMVSLTSFQLAVIKCPEAPGPAPP